MAATSRISPSIITDMEMVTALEPRYKAILAGENPPPVGIV